MNRQISINNSQLPQIKNAGYVKPGPKWIHPDRVLDYHVFLYIIEGTFEVWEEDIEYVLHKGDVLLLKAGLHHFGEKKNTDDVEWFFIHFNLKEEPAHEQMLEQVRLFPDYLLFEEPAKIYLPKTLNIHEDMRANIFNQLEMLLNKYWHQEHLASYSLNIKTLELFLDIIRNENRFLLGNRSSHLAIRMIQYLDGLGDKPYYSVEIMNKFKMNYKYLSTVFKKYAGISPKQYHMMVRIKKAAALLEKQEGSITRISTLLGFENIYHFSRVFKKVMGVPPRVYINNIYS